jgi:hypothetical protein
VDTFITTNWVATDSAAYFDSHTRLIGEFSRDWDDTWANKPDGAQIGYTTQVRLEQRWQVFEGQALQQQAILNQTVPITINHQFQVAHGWSSADQSLVVEEVQERYTKPAGKAMAAKWDATAGQEVYRSVYFQQGSPGVPLSSDKTWTDGVAKLHNAGVPDDLIVVMDPKTQSALLATNFGQFNPQGQISEYWKKGQFAGAAMGAGAWMWDPYLPVHVTGTMTASTILVSGAGQTGSTLNVAGLGTYALNAGDTFYIPGVNTVTPYEYIDTGDLQAFSLQAGISGAGTATFTISPPIITSGPLKTVTAAPANNANITFVGQTAAVNGTMSAISSKQSLMFNPGAFAFVMADLPVNLAGANAGRYNDKEAKVSMRYVDQYSITTDQLPRRLDSIGGVAAILPYFAERFWS